MITYFPGANERAAPPAGRAFMAVFDKAPAQSSVRFAINRQLFPLLVDEVAEVARQYPVVFAGSRRLPVAVLAFTPGEPLHLCALRGVEPGAYMHYLQQVPGPVWDDPENGYPMIHDPIAGQAAWPDRVDQMAGNEFELRRQQTFAFGRLLRALKLFEVRQAFGLGQGGEVAEYYAVAEERLQRLPRRVSRRLAVTGGLEAIHTHLQSLSRWQHLQM